MEAQDNLLTSKIKQAHQENMHRQLTFPFKVDDWVVLSTAHHHWVYKAGGNHHAAKFMPWFDGPYPIIFTDEMHFMVTLALPNHSRSFPIFHTSEVKPFEENNNFTFPSHALQPLNPDSAQEFFIEKIVDERRQRKGMQYLVWWCGEGPERDLWLNAGDLEECRVLDTWLAWRMRSMDQPQEEKIPCFTIMIPPCTHPPSEGRV